VQAGIERGKEKPRHLGKFAIYRPHRPQRVFIRQKTCKSGDSCAVDILRAILPVAVDIELIAVDSDGQYRPHKIPANRHIFRYAGDAGGNCGVFCIHRVSGIPLAVPR